MASGTVWAATGQLGHGRGRCGSVMGTGSYDRACPRVPKGCRNIFAMRSCDQNCERVNDWHQDLCEKCELLLTHYMLAVICIEYLLSPNIKRLINVVIIHGYQLWHQFHPAE